MAIMQVFVFPPKESLNNLVSLLSLNFKDMVCLQFHVQTLQIADWILLNNLQIIPVRDMTRMLNKCIDDTAKSQQAFINLSSFPCSALEETISCI